ncbi:MAG: DUF1643 domain-containing protein [Bacteroidota bacterium]
MDKNIHTKEAIFSENRKHRYVLTRIWNSTLPMIMCIGLNPSLADESKDDPTIRRIIDFAQQWGFGGVFVCNLFSYVTPYPKKLKIKKDTSHNDFYLKLYAEKSQEVLCAWGRHKVAKERAKTVLKMMHNTTALQLNKDGSPKHPLYVKATVERISFTL